MSIGALIVLAAASVSAEPPRSHGVEFATAQVSAEILKPAIVRQRTGLDQSDDSAPRPQVRRKGAQTLFEFE